MTDITCFILIKQVFPCLFIKCQLRRIIFIAFLLQNACSQTMIKLYVLGIEGNILYYVAHFLFCLFSIFANNSKVQEAKTFYISQVLLYYFFVRIHQSELNLKVL